MAPNRRAPGKAPVSAWVSEELKAELADRAAAEGIRLSDAVIRALEEWVQRPPDPGHAEGAPPLE